MTYNPASSYRQEMPDNPYTAEGAPEAVGALERQLTTARGADAMHPQRSSCQPGQPQIVPKNPAVALIVSFFLPGVGSMISGQFAVGMMILISYVFGCVLTFVIVGFFILFPAWVFGLVHAYQSAQRWNREHGIAS